MITHRLGISRDSPCINYLNKIYKSRTWETKNATGTSARHQSRCGLFSLQCVCIFSYTNNTVFAAQGDCK